MGFIEIIIIAVILLYSIGVIKKKVKNIKEGNGCGCGCGNCSKDCGMKKESKD